MQEWAERSSFAQVEAEVKQIPDLLANPVIRETLQSVPDIVAEIWLS